MTPLSPVPPAITIGPQAAYLDKDDLLRHPSTVTLTGTDAEGTR